MKKHQKTKKNDLFELSNSGTLSFVKVSIRLNSTLVYDKKFKNLMHYDFSWQKKELFSY